MEGAQDLYIATRAPLLSPESHSVSSLLSALSRSTALVLSEQHCSHRRYTAYLRTLVEALAPYIGERIGTEDGEKLFEGLRDAFTSGSQLQAFQVLVTGLDNNVCRALVIVRALRDFMTRQALEAVLEQAQQGLDDTVVGMIVHLSTRIGNSIYSSNHAENWDDSSYIRTVADALLDTGGGEIAGKVAEGLLVSGTGWQLVKRWGRRDDGLFKSRKVIEHVGERAKGQLVRAMAEEGLVSMLGEFFKTRGVDYATRVILLHRPLLSRRATSTIVSAVSQSCPAEVPGAMRACCVFWSAESFAKGSDIRLQQQATRAVLHWLRVASQDHPLQKVDKIYKSSMSIELATGVHHRLGHGDPRIRRLGMLVAETASRAAGDEKPLKFERKSAGRNPEGNFGDGNSSDYASDLSDLAANNDSIGAGRPLGQDSCLEVENLNAINVEKKDENSDVFDSMPSLKTEWNRDAESDDWSSLEAYSMSSDDEDTSILATASSLWRKDLKKVRESVASPHSIAQILSMLRTVAGGGDDALKFRPEMIAAAMRTVVAGSKSGSPTLQAYAPQLARAIIGIEAEKFPEGCISEISDARRYALVNLLCVNLKGVGALLIEDIICGNFAVLRKRSEAMTALTEAVRILSHMSDPTDQIDHKKLEQREEGSSIALGTTTRRLDRSLQRSKTDAKVIENEFADAADDLFYALANGIDAGGGADFLDLENRDTSIVAQALVTLAVFVSCAGPQCLTRSQMCRSLVDLSMSWSTNMDPTIRRAVAIALGSAAESISPYGLDDDHILHESGGKGDAIEWLESAAKGNDPDAYVRRFAGKALSAWASKITDFSKSGDHSVALLM